MKTKFINIAIFFFFVGLFFGCSSTTRYSKSIYQNEKNDLKAHDRLETETGIASYYTDEFNGRKTANGEIYNMNELTAAHPTYPFETKLKITNLQNGKTVIVRINDRMPQHKTRVIDLSLEAAKQLDMINAGIQAIKIEVISWGK